MHPPKRSSNQPERAGLAATAPLTRRAVLMALVLAAALPSGLVRAPAAEAAPCGYYESHWNTRAHYNHCGNTKIWIKIIHTWPVKPGYRCVGPWQNVYLNTAFDVQHAYYDGRLC